FVSDFRSSAAADQSIHVQISSGMLTTRMDAGQLTQIITNLVQNGLRYSRRNHPSAQVWLNLHHDRESDLPILEVLDDGPGVSEQHLSKIFEPFFTTESKGTGLGLYLSRELCESNQAHLEYIPRPHDGGSCLRITFAHPFKTS
ncbi:Sensor protein PilS, partial [Pseudomonas syringae pv. maculicola]